MAGPSFKVGGSLRNDTVKALLASRVLKAGDLVLEEKPFYRTDISFLTDEHTVEREKTLVNDLKTDLDHVKLKKLKTLFSHESRFWIRGTYEETPFTSLIHGSAIPLSIQEGHPGYGEIGVFPHLSRVNHDCFPNCQLIWDEDTTSASLYVLRDLEVGDELTISYVPGGAIDNAYIHETYGFYCVCRWCMRCVAYREKCVERQQVLETSRQQLDKAIFEKKVVAALESGYKALRLMRRLNINDFRLAFVYYRLFDAVIQDKDESKSKFFALHTYLAFERCEGPDCSSIKALVRRVNKIWKLNGAKGADDKGPFVASVKKIVEETPSKLGYAADRLKGDIFTEEVLTKFFAKDKWEGEAYVSDEDPEEEPWVPRIAKVKGRVFDKQRKMNPTNSAKKKQNPPVPKFNDTPTTSQAKGKKRANTSSAPTTRKRAAPRKGKGVSSSPTYDNFASDPIGSAADHEQNFMDNYGGSSPTGSPSKKRRRTSYTEIPSDESSDDDDDDEQEGPEQQEQEVEKEHPISDSQQPSIPANLSPEKAAEYEAWNLRTSQNKRHLNTLSLSQARAAEVERVERIKANTIDLTGSRDEVAAQAAQAQAAQGAQRAEFIRDAQRDQANERARQRVGYRERNVPSHDGTGQTQISMGNAELAPRSDVANSRGATRRYYVGSPDSGTSVVDFAAGRGSSASAATSASATGYPTSRDVALGAALAQGGIRRRMVSREEMEGVESQKPRGSH